MTIEEQLAMIADKKGIGTIACNVDNALEKFVPTVEKLMKTIKGEPTERDIKRLLGDSEELTEVLAEIQFAVCQLVYLLGVGPEVLEITYEMADTQLRDLVANE